MVSQMSIKQFEECEKERMVADEVIFFASKPAKKKKKKNCLDKHFCFRFGTIVIVFLFIDVERHVK